MHGVPASLRITQVVCLDCAPNLCCRAEAECTSLRAIAALAMVKNEVQKFEQSKVMDGCLDGC
jgi:hypothetical protein